MCGVTLDYLSIGGSVVEFLPASSNKLAVCGCLREGVEELYYLQ